MDRVHSLLTWYPEPVSRFTSLPLQASPASLPPASAPALLLPCATALVRALVRASSARRRDHCPAAAVGRSRACTSLSHRAAARARVPAPAGRGLQWMPHLPWLPLAAPPHAGRSRLVEAAPALLHSGNQARPSTLLAAPAQLRSGNQARPSALLAAPCSASLGEPGAALCSALLSLGAE